MKIKPKILILTDSVSLPRKLEDGHVNWEDTYIYRLKETFTDFEIISIAIGGATIRDLRNQVVYYSILAPNIVILQCGIVDCFPRAFGRIEMELIKKFRLLRLTKPFVNFIRKYRAHKYVSKRKFEKTLLEIKSKLNPQDFFSLSILPPCDEYEKKASGITKNIDTYNSILERNTQYIDLSEIPRNGILNDFHHINEIGHEYIFNCITKQLNQWSLNY